MKKKLSLFLVAVLTVIVATFGLVACTSKPECPSGGEDTPNPTEYDPSTPAGFFQKMGESGDFAVTTLSGDSESEVVTTFAIKGNSIFSDMTVQNVRVIVYMEESGGDMYMSIDDGWIYSKMTQEQVDEQLKGLTMEQYMAAAREVIKGMANAMAIVVQSMPQKDGYWYLNGETGSRMSVDGDILRMQVKESADSDVYIDVMDIDLGYEIVIPEGALQAKSEYQKSLTK